MSDLDQTIQIRHGRDRWKDAVFVAAALLLTALSIASVTSKAAGKTTEHQWSLTVVESNLEVGR